MRESLIATMSREELREAAEHLDTDEIADLAPDLPQNVMRDVFKSLPIEEREQLRVAMAYPEDSVGALMDFNMVHVREDVTLEVVSRYLRRFDKLPDHTDQIFVVDRDDRFKGVLPINMIVVNEPDVVVGNLMLTDTIRLDPDVKADLAAQSFERYDLVSAPVVDEDGKLVGRVTVNVVLDFIRAESETELLNQAGLREEEDIFASVWKSAQNRWAWLALNLCTAFFASRVIGGFENTIVKYVALATLMPIVAGIAGNSANQTTTIIIRSLALGQITNGQYAPADAQGIDHQRAERTGVGRYCRIVRLLSVSQHCARHRDDQRDAAKPDRGRDRRVVHPSRHAEDGARPGHRFQRHDHRHHRQRRIFHLPRIGDDLPRQLTKVH